MRQNGLGIFYDFDDIPEERLRFTPDRTKATAFWVSRRHEDRYDEDVSYEIAVWDVESGEEIEHHTRTYSLAKNTSTESGLHVVGARFDSRGRVWIEFKGGVFEDPHLDWQASARELYDFARKERDMAIARALYLKASEQGDDRRIRGLSLMALGMHAAAMSEFERARGLFEEAWEILKIEGSIGERGACLFYQADVQDAPDYAPALELLEQAGDHALAGMCCYRMAWSGQYGEAILVRSADHFRAAGDDFTLVEAIRLRAERLATDEAFALINEACGIVGRLEGRWARRLEAQVLETLGDLCRARGLRSDAADAYARSLEMYRLVDGPSRIVEGKLAAL